MTILSAHTASRIRNRSMGVLHLIAADEGCEYADIIKLITPLAPAHAPAADTPAAPPASETDGEGRNSSPEPAPSVEPIHEPAAPASDPAKPTDPQAKHAAKGALSSEPGGVQDRCESTPPTPSHQGEILGEKVTAPCDTAAAGKPGEGHEPSPAPPVDRAALVRDCVAANPSWPAKLIGAAVGLSTMTVCALAGRYKINLPTQAQYEAAQTAKTTASLSARVKTETPPATKPAAPAQAPVPVERDASDVLHTIRRPANPARFYLRDKITLLYVHQSLQPSPDGPGPMMTSDRKWAWFDNFQRFKGAAAKWPELADMRKEAPAK